MHWLDISLGVVMLLGGIRSYFRGLTREIMSTIGLIAVFVLAMWGYAYAPPYFESMIASPWWRQVAIYVALVVVAAGVYMLWSQMVERMLYGTRLSIPDRVLGGLFGVVKVGIAIAIVSIVLVQALPDRLARLVPGSQIAPLLLQTSQSITTMLPREVRHEFERSYGRVRQRVGKRPDQSPSPSPAAFNSPAQAPQAPTNFSEQDDRALRQLIIKNSQEP